MTPDESFQAGVTAEPPQRGPAGYLAGPSGATPTPVGVPGGHPPPPYDPPVALFTSHRRRSRAVPVAVGCAVVVLIAAPVIAFLAARAGSGAADPAASPAPTPETRLEAAKRECAQRSPEVSLGDEGTSMVISRVLAEENPGATWQHLSCVFVKVDIPDAVVSHIEGTRALDGRQQASWDGFEASWTYHPDDGLNLILRETG